MKEKILLVLGLVLSLSLLFAACNQDSQSTDKELPAEESAELEEPSSEVTEPEENSDEALKSFSWKAYFIAREGEQIGLLVPGEADDFRGPLMVNLSPEQQEEAAKYKLGDSLEVVHDGAMMMSYPGQINALSIRKLEAEEALPKSLKMPIDEIAQAIPVFAEQFKTLDLRTKEDFEAGHIPGAENLPLAELSEKLAELTDSEQAILVYAEAAEDSAKAAEELVAAGAKLVIDLGEIADYSGQLVSE